MKSLLDFLFGKDARIFNKKGTVEHDLGKSQWSLWTDRFSKNSEYDFTQHEGRSDKKPIAKKDPQH